MAEKCSNQKFAQASHTTWSLSKFPCTLNATTAIVPVYKRQGGTDSLMEVCPTPPQPLIFWKGRHKKKTKKRCCINVKELQ